ncbi:hypothetical protein [Bacteroides sp. 44_46]|uniref:hypothetical protein n=1 Tax=Bacteroides sp. 44_46 TaxID=1897052 RepID=UPI0009616AA4|nr:hypothetical protein [Bacteroides sp. 44_46]OKY99570.1 MAG: hypothetical protein BHV73_08590 [Bacteroides sp. 44_46]DAW84687.1 MAG TPA: hypothetical protein [Bacteriophage sp.]
MSTEINNVILTPTISETISILQSGGANACCNTIDKATGLILDLKVDNEVSTDDIISIISDLRIVSSMIKRLAPQEEEVYNE